MKVVNGTPPNIEAIKERFPLSGMEIFCYGDTIYNPAGAGLSPELIAHERVHSERQGDDPEGWWDRYIADQEFRYYEELVAHRMEYRVFRKRHRDRELVDKYLQVLARRLAAPMYGNVATPGAARKAIRQNGGKA